MIATAPFFDVPCDCLASVCVCVCVALISSREPSGHQSPVAASP